MAETKKFVDLTGLDYFWSKVEPIITEGDAAAKTYAENKATDALNTAKTYVDGKVDGKFDTVGSAAQALADAKTYFNTENDKDAIRMLAIEGDVDALEATVGDTTSGLVQEVAALRAEMNALGGIDGGDGIGGMIDAKIGALDVEDAAVEGQYVSSVSEVDGKITVARVALPDYTDAFAAKANASDLTTHTGDAVAHITADERKTWNDAEQNAKTYADGLNTAMDARVDALEAQDKYVAADVTAAITKAQEDAQTYADGLNTAMDGRVDKLEAIDHEAIAAQAAADAVAAVVANAPEDLNTLKEVADYIAADKTKASEIETSISDLGKADAKIREDFAAADATLETSLKSYADQAEADAKSYTDSLVKDSEGKSLFDAAGAAATAKSEAIEAAAADAESKYQVKGDYEAAGAAAQALVDAKAYTDGKVDGKFDAAGSASAAETAAKKYTDDTIAAFEFASEDDINALFA